MHADERITVFEADCRHDAADGAVAGRQIIAHAGLTLDRQRRDIAAQRRKRCPLLPVWIDQSAPPYRLSRTSRVSPGKAAQDAIRRRLEGWIRGEPVALPGVECRLRNWVEVRLVTCQADNVGPISQFAAQQRLREPVAVVDDGMNDWKLRLHVIKRQTVEIHCARIEIAALAASGQIELRDGLKP